MRFICACVLIMLSALTGAQTARAEKDMCEVVGQIAEAIMQRRQNGSSLQSSLELVRKVGPEGTAKVFEALVIAAYERPMFSTDDNKKSAVGEFRDDSQLACIKGTRSK
ncbi:hypothetical protein BJF92_12050 [Rhizobium rhizosphaerae]|uniref:Uncharacterized protein n=1 Tax=Xaviernesmea rhizosphaerae TaxID=1672749 RepID=A0A1Q9AN25_9HYPH|nr:hypothetical protein [Xaviernesmea rhizosphaerae]OLP56798.1 hypothetical protein BJF92_12050 [Xaviernesmea rhizosphaerae]